MCGRYALSLRASQVRDRLASQNMPADDAPDDDDDRVRTTYNFAPGYHGLIYRADTPPHGGSSSTQQSADETDEPVRKRAKHTHSNNEDVTSATTTTPMKPTSTETRYKLQAAKWGLIPFWTKRPPDYSSQLKTINCRDDSLIENRGMWNTMKQRKRCIVIAEGFYEWLKKNGDSKNKVPHFVKRKDGGLMCMAGLWDYVKYEGEDEQKEGLWSYTIITTDSNKQLRFLHDRMPVILEPGSEEIKAWLDPERVGWDKELQSMLKPFEGELEVYPVDKAVGKVGNNSPSFVVPVDSKENKKNIANFFGAQRERQENMENEDRATSKVEESETNAPLPKPKGVPDSSIEAAINAPATAVSDGELKAAEDESVERGVKREISAISDDAIIKAEEETSPLKKSMKASPVKMSPAKKTRSAVSNGTVAKTPTKEGDRRITAFFGK